MSSLLIGNGINIQYGGLSCSNKAIIKRVITSVNDSSFPMEAITLTDSLQPLWLIGTLYRQIPNVLKGKFDELAIASFEKAALASFRDRYSEFEKRSSPLDVGMEDYFFLLELFFRENGVRNPEASAIREALKRIFAYSIYDGGKLNDVYLNYPLKLKEFFNSFDLIFTTNYDSNIEAFTGARVLHLHGCFDTLSYLYDESSFRNQLSDHQLDSAFFDPSVAYLFSNAIFSYSGALKEFEMNQSIKTNEGLEKLLDGYLSSEQVRETIESWLDDDNRAIRNLAESILQKQENPALEFDEYYGIREFHSIDGLLSIVGLSPNNDSHIFDLLKSNTSLSRVTYYYHSQSDVDIVSELLPSNDLSFVDVRTLWEKYE